MTQDKVSEIQRVRDELAAAQEAVTDARVRLAVLTNTGFGEAGIRDPEFPCTAFEPGVPDPYSGALACHTDGHYLCDECSKRATCETGCGRRPSQCECKYCETCDAVGSNCRCEAAPQ